MIVSIESPVVSTAAVFEAVAIFLSSGTLNLPSWMLSMDTILLTFSLVFMLHISDYQKFISFVEWQIEIREKDLLITHHPCDDQMVTVVIANNVVDRLPEYRGILNLTCKAISVGFSVCVALSLLFLLFDDDLEGDFPDDPYVLKIKEKQKIKLTPKQISEPVSIPHAG